jgi:ribosome biogenesis GTPase A
MDATCPSAQDVRQTDRSLERSAFRMIDRETVIQWYPGHMAAAMRQIEQRIRLIDVFIEVIDARMIISGSNPVLGEVIGRKPRLIVLSREDLADPDVTKAWLDAYAARNVPAAAVNARSLSSYTNANFQLMRAAQAAKTRGIARAMVVGIPNSGKSTVINGLLKRTVAKAEDKAGVTRAPQWFKVGPNLELMDMPGILPPKIESEESQWILAMCGAIPRDRFAADDVVGKFVEWSRDHRRGRPVPDLEAFASARRMLRSGGELELHNAALSYLKDFNDGKFGRISFERPPADSHS